MITLVFANDVLIAIGFAAAAYALWSFMEYVLHRFAFHEARGRNCGSREHLGHHARRDYDFFKNWEAWVGVVLVGAALVVPGWWLAGPVGGWAFGLGFVLAYFTYEGIHAIAHVAGPCTRYGRWFRKLHFHHHFAEPLRNQGVTTPLRDKVFGTLTVPDQVVVPCRMAMVWLLDDDGEVKPEYRADYVLRGGRAFREEAELPRAMSNLPPLLDEDPVLDRSTDGEPARV